MDTCYHKSLTSLDLLEPWSLPVDHPLSGPQKRDVSEALQRLLDALRVSSAAEALDQMDRIIRSLKTVAIKPPSIEQTRTSLGMEEIEDYDRYFRVRHVETQDVAGCMVGGLLVACRAFMKLCCRMSTLDPIYVSQQKQGFIAYTRLLGRVFDLSELT